MKSLLFLLIFTWFFPNYGQQYKLEDLAITHNPFKGIEYRMTYLEKKYDLVVEATAYGAEEDGGLTCFSKPIIPYHTLAVDPAVIPYGSKVYFHSTDEEYVAGDCGGDIVGKRVDKALPSKAKAFEYGRRMEKVTVTLPYSEPLFYEVRVN